MVDYIDAHKDAFGVEPICEELPIAGVWSSSASNASHPGFLQRALAGRSGPAGL